MGEEIVGYNEPGADGTSKVIGGDGAKKGVNAAHVIGKRRVGGIIGANPADGTISGWLNRGFVAAQEEYAGGIAGCNGYPEESGTSGVNSAVIHNCSSEVISSYPVRTTPGSWWIPGCSVPIIRAASRRATMTESSPAIRRFLWYAI
ncbi:MAG: hypothetical protein ACLTT1_01760 [[Clostridium] scindens]